MNKIIITGASGFLGKKLINRLTNEKDLIVYALSSKNIVTSAPNIFSVHKDIIDCDAAREIFTDAIVVNCAFPRNSTGTGMADGLAYINRLFLTCKKYKTKAIINISSQSVYSQKRTDTAIEDTEICLESPYAVGKFATELMLKSVCDGSTMVYTNLRMASLIGPGFNQRIVNRLIQKAMALEPIAISVSDQRFGFLDVCDAVEAIVSLLITDTQKWKDVYNVGNGVAVSLHEIINAITEVFKEHDLSIPDISFIKEDKTGSSALSYHRLHNDTGYKPKISLIESTNRILIDLQREC